ncbi:hypothetical protein Emin_0320 [Elusimicrobium minutum Pei191]|uniref:Lipoprotein n=1 Tax=Elusimicrobium minutum (strain Pei191) TaxID=445932 RepID=B2KBX5_ELUMP|nr:hypothetical protein [Elusimicrobium minutum]ACC97879.1 hypothetical protein Emin_0320 [Elusimicrobium minutum Pei191]
MRNIILFITVFIMFSCAGNVTYDSAYASNKEWLEVVSDKKDWEGKQVDSCFKLNFKFIPEEAKNRLDKRFSCTQTCCWRSDMPEVVLDFNRDYAQDLAMKGRSRKYEPGVIRIKIKYSSVLGVITASVTPAGAISRDGTIKLKYKEETNLYRISQLEKQKTIQDEAYEAKKIIQNAREAELKTQEQKRISTLTLNYNKKQSIDYVKRFFGYDIDNYLYRLDREDAKKGYILINGDKEWNSAMFDNMFLVTCVSDSKRGKTQNSLKPYPIHCGIWLVDLDNNTVVPHNALAKQIAAK